MWERIDDESWRAVITREVYVTRTENVIGRVFRRCGDGQFRPITLWANFYVLDAPAGAFGVSVYLGTFTNFHHAKKAALRLAAE